MLNHGCVKIIIKMLEIYNKIIFHRWSREQLKIKKNKDVLRVRAHFRLAEKYGGGPDIFHRFVNAWARFRRRTFHETNLMHQIL